MKDSIKSVVNTILIIAIILLGSLLLFQWTYADQISFSNDMIDHILHFTSVVVLITIILLLLNYAFLHVKKRWHKFVLGAVATIAIFFWLISLLFSSYVVFSSEKTNERYYFSESDGYKYYIVSERFVAFSGSPDIYFYKEKPRFY
jgi:uncharacterized BrkB/YihY/UPF0761 family membrane protein